MLFSIIVPIYNVEKYLPQCIESVLNQSYGDFELILVDDGTPDNSGMICDEYAEKDKRICVLHKENGGLSDARNAGLSLAKGEFVWFLDSDDYMAENAIYNVTGLIMANHDTDMITCAHINEYSDGNSVLASLPINRPAAVSSRNEFLTILYKNNGAYWAAWKNIFRKAVIDRNKLSFIKGLIGAEDCEFFMRFVRHGEKFTFLNMPIIHYRIDREGSITNTMSKAAIMGQLIVFSDNYVTCMRDSNYKNKYMKVFFANKFANTISLMYHLTKPAEIDEVTGFVKDHAVILKDAKGMKYNIAKLVWLLFGFHKGSGILHSIR